MGHSWSGIGVRAGVGRGDRGWEGMEWKEMVCAWRMVKQDGLGSDRMAFLQYVSKRRLLLLQLFFGGLDDLNLRHP